MNKRSFFLGVFVGVLVTWALSFYLYYSLSNSQPAKATKLQQNIFNFKDSDEDESDEKKAHNSIDDTDKEAVGKASYFKSKLKKEKERRKISRKLADELQPVTIKQQEEFGIIKTVEDQHVRYSGYKTHAFNVLVSNHIGSFREIPDTRHKV